MATQNLRISQLPIATSIAPADVVLVVQGGVTKQTTQDAIAAAVAASTQLSATYATLTGLDSETTRAAAAEAAAAQRSANLSDLANAATARTNLGLGTAATHAATEFDVVGAAAAITLSGLGGINSSGVDSKVTAAINALVAGAPGALDTLNEIAVQLGSDETAATALTALVNARALSAATVTMTAAGLLTGSARNTLDGTSAGFTATLPAPTKVGQVMVVQRIDATTTNALTIAATAGATIGGDSAASVVLPAVGVANEGFLFVAESLTSWVVAASHKSKAWLDALYAPFTQGRRMITEYTTTNSGIAVPTGVLGCWLDVLGGGGGGGSGRRGAAGTAAYGGGGGGAGGFLRVWVPAAQLSTTFSITIGTGGGGSAAITVDSTGGGAGSAGGDTSFTTGSLTIRGAGGTPGAGGGAASGNGGAGGIGSQVGGTGGSSSATAAPTTTGSVYGDVSGGGGAGGGISTADVAFNGGNSGGNYSLNMGANTSAGGVVGGANPVIGQTGTMPVRGSGGGGGAASTTTAAQAGAGTSGVRGSGGGGGGASRNGFASGSGGQGAIGWARVEWVYG